MRDSYYILTDPDITSDSPSLIINEWVLAEEEPDSPVVHLVYPSGTTLPVRQGNGVFPLVGHFEFGPRATPLSCVEYASFAVEVKLPVGIAEHSSGWRVLRLAGVGGQDAGQASDPNAPQQLSSWHHRFTPLGTW